MKIVFIGQAQFGRDSLEALLKQGENIVGVITVPDAPKPKQPNPVVESAKENNIPLLQTALLKQTEAVTWVKNLQPDLLVLAFVTSFVPKDMIDCTQLGGINYHPSLLPQYRGGSAINWAIINGETETGVSIHYIDEGVDTGPIILQETTAIETSDTVKSLYFKKLYPMGVRMIAQAVKQIRDGSAVAIEQDETKASFQPVINSKDTIIDWNQTTQSIYNLVRGSNPTPGGITTLNGKTCKIFDASPDKRRGLPGEVIQIDNDSFTVATKDGALRIESIQFEKNKKQPAHEFAQIYKLAPKNKFGT